MFENCCLQLIQIWEPGSSQFGFEFGEKKEVTGGKVWTVGWMWSPDAFDLSVEGHGFI